MTKQAIEVENEQLAASIKEHMPQIDKEIFQYVYGVLTAAIDELTSPEEVFECLGELIADVRRDCNREQVITLCGELLEALLGDRPRTQTSVDTQKKLLQAPVHLGDMFDEQESELNHYKSIWCVNREVQSQVNKKKLNKAEAKLRLKQVKRDAAEAAAEGAPGGAPWQKEACTSQMISKGAMNNDETSRSKDIKIENFDISFGNKKLLEGADLGMGFGRRYGLVGRNGIGKSTLLKMVSNGSLVIPKHISILHVEQEVVGDDTTALESVLESDELRTSLLKEEKELSTKSDEQSAARLQEVFAKLNEIEADKAPARAGQILSGLGFTQPMQERATKTYSGGWRMRIALARALFSKPDLLLLDEPTNMLDMKAIIWLQNYLVNHWVSILLVVSHDKSFLNAIATDILHYHNRKVDAYRGDYDNYEKAKVEKLKNQEREYEAQAAFRKHVQEFIDKFRYNAKRASLVQSKIKMIEKLPPLEPVLKESKVVLKFADPEPIAGAPILQLDEVSFRYADNLPYILDGVCANATLESRICIVGDNGSGKTTLLKLLNGHMDPSKGMRNVHRSLNIGYFSQHHVDQLTMNQCGIEFLATKFPGKPSEYYRGYLGRFGVTGDLGTQPIAALSGGQKSRVAFAAMALSNPSLLILDEPTNHLDVETVEALGEAINKFKGGVILVSHDQQLIRMICKELWLVRDKKVETIKGGFEEYRRIVDQELKEIV
jgi:ATP-binding cassette subfamily F protein 3